MASSLVLEQPGRWRTVGISSVFLVLISPALPLLVGSVVSPIEIGDTRNASITGPDDAEFYVIQGQGQTVTITADGTTVGNNTGLDKQGFAPIGRIVEGMDVVNNINDEYGEGAPRGKGPDQGSIQQQGNAYLNKSFSRLDYINTATIVVE